MREVGIKVTKKGSNLAATDLVLHKVYPAVRYEPGEFDEQGDLGDEVYYVVYDEVGERCGLYLGFDGIVIKEV
ncbi:MAG: hypothetical protein [Enterobacter phage ENC16]|nr:MAG: hypothetical protein [Enterobacter phage ENC16]